MERQRVNRELSSEDHVIPLGHGEFSAWRSFCLRTAGMPFDWVSSHHAAGQPMFQEALVWQQPRIAAQLHKMLAKGSNNRILDRTVASYRSRFCAKNDTIGYFGPVSWGTWVDHDTELEAFRPPPRGPVFLEVWAVRAVAEALTERHGLHDWIVPHVVPAVAPASDGVYLADGSFLRLSPVQRRILHAVDGFRTVVDIVAECADLGPLVRVAAELRIMQAMGVLTKGMALAQGRHPERQLAMQLARIADPARRVAAQNELASVVSARDEVRRSLDDPERVAASIAALNDRFTRVADRPSRRRDGEFYAGRSVAYEDCVSELRPRLDTGLLAGIAPALELVLHSARWFSARVADAYVALVREILRADPASSSTGYPLPTLLTRLMPTFVDSESGPVGEVARELRRRWTRLLVAGPNAGPICHTSAALRADVLATFEAATPGWPSARWHSPDLMLAASSPEDLRHGGCLAVLGELHTTTNSTDQLLMFDAHPDQPALRRWIDADMPDRIVPIYSSAETAINSRTAPPEAYHSPSYTYLGLGTEPSYASRRARLVPAGSLRVHDAAGQPVVRSVGGDFQADLVEVLDDFLAHAAYNRFGLLTPAEHQPRVQIDGLVVSREQWRVPMHAFAQLPQARLERVAAHVRQVAAEHHLPNPAFWVISGERKPMYLDLRDTGLVDAVWAKVRRGRQRVPDGSVVVTEMLPGPDQLWLGDDAGHRYTAEFRLVCVDQQHYPPTHERI
jgi:hypothetical protein